APAPIVHVPVSGGAWPLTVGTGVPFGSFDVHVNDSVLHHSLAPQSASTAQPPIGSHTPLFAPQAPERHTTAAFPCVQGPSPFAYPQLPSGSHALERQTVAPFAGVHGPSEFA